MRKIYFLFILNIFLADIYAQNIHMTTYSQNDSVYIHWVPTDLNVYKSIFNKGVKIEIIPWNSNEKPKDSDFIGFSEKKTEELPIVKQLLKKDSSLFGPSSLILLDGMINGGDSATVQMSFIQSLIYSGVDSVFSKEIGLYRRVKNPFESQYLGLKASNGKDYSSFSVVRINKEVPKSNHFDSLKAVCQNGEVNLSWNVENLLFHYSSFNIERSTDKKQWNRINKTPFIYLKTDDEKEGKPAMFVDKNVEKGQAYYYRIKGVNHLCFENGVSNIIEIQVPRPINGLVYIDSLDVGESLVVKYKFNGDQSELEYVKKVNLTYSDKIYGQYSLLKSKGSKLDKFFSIDFKKLPERGFFRIEIISKSADTLFSEPKYFFFRDSIPPEKIQEFEASIDTNGIVQLSWEKLDDQLEGYRVFRRNSSKEQFIEITKEFVIDTVFRDTISIRNLTRGIYYAVKAVDLNHNNGELSDPVKVLKPDIIPPVPSRIISTNFDENGISLEWSISTSKDVEYIYLQKRIDSSFKNVYKTVKTPKYLDSDTENGKSYTYRLLTQDSSGNQSYSKDITVEYELGYRIHDPKIKYEVNREEDYVKLEWTNPKKVSQINIYFAKQDRPLRMVESYYDNRTNHQFRSLAINNEYRVKLQFVYLDGSRSKLSEEVLIEY